MHFAKNISSFIVGALLATSAVGELTRVPRGASGASAARGEANAVRGLSSIEQLQKRADACTDAIKRRRSLKVRASKTVGVDDSASGKGSDILSTNSLASCYGVAITGSYEGDNDGDDRWLSHALEAERDPAEKIFDGVESARDNGLKNLYALLVYPDPSSFTNEDDFDDEARKDVQAEHDWYVEWIADATGVKPEEKGHSWKEPWGIKINSNKGVSSGRFV
ncbi:hypothetical protein F4777DRAFT_598930 [Nemania sp. FL0916]|nr:hypothetical protein F4777DRAFT_598930 [Nemania sp. FL0916]